MDIVINPRLAKDGKKIFYSLEWGRVGPHGFLDGGDIALEGSAVEGCVDDYCPGKSCEFGIGGNGGGTNDAFVAQFQEGAADKVNEFEAAVGGQELIHGQFVFKELG